MQRVGFVGLGRMGGPCVRNLLAKGYEVRIWARTPEKARCFVEAGAVLCGTPAGAAAESDIFLTCVTAGSDVEDILLGKNGVCAGARPGLVCADMSTISVSVARELAERVAERGFSFLDAPVSGGVKAAERGTLAIWAGGDASAFNRARSVLEAMGTHVRYLGPSGSGQVAKACNQLVVSASLLAVGEAFHLCETSGVNPSDVREALLDGGSAAGFVLENQGKRMLSHEPDTGFTIRLLLKDIRQILEQKTRTGMNLPLTEEIAAQLESVVACGFGDEGTTRLFRLLSVAHSARENI